MFKKQSFKAEHTTGKCMEEQTQFLEGSTFFLNLHLLISALFFRRPTLRLLYKGPLQAGKKAIQIETFSWDFDIYPKKEGKCE